MTKETRLQEKTINMLLDLNAVPVTVTRKEYVPVGGGRKEETSTLGPFKVAVFGSPARSTPIFTDALKMDRVSHIALTSKDADFKSGGHVEDTFETPNYGKFKVHTVSPIEMHTEITGKVLYLELLK